jgi:hypothetical protein
MLNKGEGLPNPSRDFNLSNMASKEDILNEIRITNELLRQMIKIMYEIRFDLQNTNKLLFENYKMEESQMK